MFWMRNTWFEELGQSVVSIMVAWVLFVSPIYNLANILNLEKHLCTGHLRVHPSVHPKVGGFDFRRGCGMRGVVTVTGSTTASTIFLAEEVEGEGREWGSACFRPAAGETCCFLWEVTSVTGGCSRKGREEGQELKEDVSCCLPWDSGRRTAHDSCPHPQNHPHYQVLGTPKTPVLSTQLTPVCTPPLLFLRQF